MRVISRAKLKQFWELYPDAEDALEMWHRDTTISSWDSPSAIKEKYRNASILKGGRVVFNICGNKYRLVVKVAYKKHLVFVRFVGTHKEYDRINAEEV